MFRKCAVVLALARGLHAQTGTGAVLPGAKMLDNMPHIKAYWVMMTPRVAPSPRREEWLDPIRKTGREPVERDTLYRRVERGESTFTVLV